MCQSKPAGLCTSTSRRCRMCSAQAAQAVKHPAIVRAPCLVRPRCSRERRARCAAAASCQVANASRSHRRCHRAADFASWLLFAGEDAALPCAIMHLTDRGWSSDSLFAVADHACFIVIASKQCTACSIVDQIAHCRPFPLQKRTYGTRSCHQARRTNACALMQLQRECATCAHSAASRCRSSTTSAGLKGCLGRGK